METLVGKPKQIAENQELGAIKHLMHYEDRLYADQGYVERCIMIHLAALREVDDPISRNRPCSQPCGRPIHKSSGIISTII